MLNRRTATSIRVWPECMVISCSMGTANYDGDLMVFPSSLVRRSAARPMTLTITPVPAAPCASSPTTPVPSTL